MKYVVAIVENNNDVEISVPDLPGCNETAASIDVAMGRIKDAIASHLAILAEYGEEIPQAKSIDQHIKNNRNNAIIWAIIDFDITPYLGRSHKINVTLPELLIKQIDDRVSKSEAYKTRSGFIAKACLLELQNSEK